MPLRLTLKPNERFIVNGCVIKNGPRRHVIEVENRADVLREDDMLHAETATTPVRRVAYHIQIALVSATHRNEYDPLILRALEDLANALPRFAQAIASCEEQVQSQNYYGAYRALAPLIAHEDLLFAHVKKGEI